MDLSEIKQDKRLYFQVIYSQVELCIPDYN
jgi:hypothetical protein